MYRKLVSNCYSSYLRGRASRCLLSTSMQSEGASLQKALLRAVKPNVEALTSKYFPDVKVEPVPINPVFTDQKEEKKIEVNPIPIVTSTTKTQPIPATAQTATNPRSSVSPIQFTQGHLHEFAPRIIVSFHSLISLHENLIIITPILLINRYSELVEVVATQ
jgi:hypothetical protein